MFDPTEYPRSPYRNPLAGNPDGSPIRPRVTKAQGRDALMAAAGQFIDRIVALEEMTEVLRAWCDHRGALEHPDDLTISMSVDTWRCVCIALSMEVPTAMPGAKVIEAHRLAARAEVAAALRSRGAMPQQYAFDAKATAWVVEDCRDV